MKFWKRKPKEEPATITIAAHTVVVDDLQRQIAEMGRECRAFEQMADHYRQQRDEARAGEAANAEDAAKYRRSVANLKQNRKAPA